MLPNNEAFAPGIVSDFLNPDILETIDNQLVSYERGGAALNNGSQGLQVQNWVCFLSGNAVKTSPVGSEGSATTLFTVSGEVTSLSIAFDTNMAPAVAFIEDNLAKLWWFDPIASAYTTTSYPGVISCRLATDEKRRAQTGITDIIFGYISADILYWRQQRDRYQTEYTAGPAGGRVLQRMGMNAEYRFQFELVYP